MLVKAKLVDLELREHKGKQVCDMTLKLSHPSEAITVTLWNNSVSAGEHKIFENKVGKDVEVALQARVWNGNLQYSFQSTTPAAKAA